MIYTFLCFHWVCMVIIGKISRYRNLLDKVSSFSGVKDLIVFLIIKMTSFKSFLIYITESNLIIKL